MSDSGKFSRGARAAVELVTAARASLAENDEVFASRLSAVMRDVTDTSSPRELLATIYALTIMAANPMNGEELTTFALELSKGAVE